MANDTILFEVKTTATGLKVVQKDVNALADGVERTNVARDKAGKSQNAYHKREKALTQSTLSSGRAMSKLNQTIGGGSSGLVGAYATLMANVFALTAAFGELRRASALDILTKGLEATGAAAGVNLQVASKGLQEVTGFAISAEQALKGMALGTSAGFNTGQIEGLAKVARGASIALGRDMGDAMDRLIRGTAKLEPEILDELGIMVRLDDATTKYAATLGKNADDLTQYERRQAFLNATLEQGQKKFKDVLDAADTNPYDRLAASMNNLVKSGLTLVNEVLGPLASMLANSTGALIGAVILFGSTISRQLLPGLSDMAKGVASAATAQGELAASSLKNLKVAKVLPDAYNEAVTSMADGEINQTKFNKALHSTNSSITRHAGGLKKMTIANFEEAKSYGGKWVRMQQVKKARFDLIRAYTLQQGAQAKQGIADAVEITQQRGLIAGFQQLNVAISTYSAKVTAASASSGLLVRSWAQIQIAGMAFAGTLRVIGTAILGMLGWIGLAVTAGALIYDTFKNMIPVDEMDENLKELEEKLTITKEIADKFNKSAAEGGVESAEAQQTGYKSLQGQLGELQNSIKKFVSTADTQYKRNVDAWQKHLDKMELAYKNTQDRINKLRENPNQKKYGFFGATNEEEAQALEKANKRLLQKTKGFEARKTAIDKKGADSRIEAGKTVIAEQIASLQKQGGNYKTFISGTIADLQDLMSKTGEGLEFDSIQKVNAELEKMKNNVGKINSAWEGADESRSRYDAAVAKKKDKTQTPFDDVLKGAQEMRERLQELREGYGLAADGSQDATTKNKGFTNSLEALRKKMAMDELKTGHKTWDAYTAALEGTQKQFAEIAKEVVRVQKVSKKLSELNKEIGGGAAMKMQIDAQNKLTRTRQKQYEVTIEGTLLELNHQKALAFQLGSTEQRRNIINELIKEGGEDLVGIAKELKAHVDLENDIINSHVSQQMQLEAIAKKAKEINDLRLKALSVEKDILKANQDVYKNNIILDKIAKDKGRLRKTGVALNAIEELEVFLRYEQVRRQLINDEYELKKTQIELEFEIMGYRMEVTKAEMEAALSRNEIGRDTYNKVIASMNKIPQLQEKVKNSSLSALALRRDADLQSLDVERLKSQVAAERSATEIANSDMTMAEKFSALGKAQADMILAGEAAIRAKAEEAYKKDQAPGIESGLITQSHISAAGDVAVAAATDTDKLQAAGQGDKLSQTREKMQQLNGLFAGMRANMAALGPEGEAMAMMQEGAFSLMDTWMEVGEQVKAGSFGMTEAIGAISGSVTALASLMAAKSKMEIANVDKEIAAEKKRDGKSKESLAKIAALEKKKEGMKRKAFEQNKKMMMAQAVAGTAMAIINAMQTKPFVPAGLAMAVIAGAMGAAQLAVISSMSYSGGGGGVNQPSTPSTVSMGSRNNKVDVRGGNVAGELAYLRGEQGTGTGASNFRATGRFAGGYVNRFSGGDATAGVGYIVGEQGPELFLPDRPGMVRGADDMAVGMGTPVNANFTINTIDASTMEDTLITQRGNIISMIREAANNSGETFLESVDTLGLQVEYD